MESITSRPGSLSERSDDWEGAVLVLIGFPGSGKSETGNTLIGQRDFKTALQKSSSKRTQEAKSIIGDLHVTVRDMPSFESISEFMEIYDSLTDLDCRKVVFGLTIAVGRFPTEYTVILKRLFKENGIGEHLKRKTFLIFTKIDELLRYDEVFHEDIFIKWLRESDGIDQLITSLNLRYCVIQNKQSGDKQEQQANLVIQQLKYMLKNGNEQETWYRRDENILSIRSDVRSNEDAKNQEEDSYENPSYDQIKKKKLTITVDQALDEIVYMQLAKNKTETIEIIDQILSNYTIETKSSNKKIAETILREFDKRKERSLDICAGKHCNIM